MRISDLRSDVCSSDLRHHRLSRLIKSRRDLSRRYLCSTHRGSIPGRGLASPIFCWRNPMSMIENPFMRGYQNLRIIRTLLITYEEDCPPVWRPLHASQAHLPDDQVALFRSEEHTSELQSLMRHSYAVFCL